MNLSSIQSKEFAQRRKELMALMDPDSIAILPSATVQRRSRDIDFQYRQDSDFYYLTGFTEANSVFVLSPGREHGEAILFCQEDTDEYERWHGRLVGPDRACQYYGFDDAFPIADIDEILPGLIEGRNKLYYAMGVNRDFDNHIIEWVNTISEGRQRGAQPPGEFIQLEHLLHELRLFKSREEIKLLRQASRITVDGHRRVMALLKPGMMEYQVEAELHYEFTRRGARSLAYPCIVGSGLNSCILHYTANDSAIANGDLVLIDAGCEYACYAADVTRTLPANGTYSAAQRELYEIVLEAQNAAIEQVLPGNHWNQPHEAATKVLCQGLLDLGILHGGLDEVLESGSYQRFCMHKTGHWLGLDVHDVGEYRIDGEWRIFERGMVTTIEPGIYIGPNETDVDAAYRGMGLRIEDNILVTDKGCDILTADLPRNVADIEALMADRQGNG